MGNIKRHNRTLPLHPERHPETMPEMVFFEQIIKREVDRAVHDEVHGQIHYYPEMTTDLSGQMEKPR